MPEQNPYQPPDTEPNLEETAALGSSSAPVNYPGGILFVLVVAVGAGFLIGLGVSFGFTSNTAWGGWLAFGTPAVGLLLALACLAAMLRNSRTNRARRILVAALLAIPAYVLFVPVCTFTGVVSMSTVGAFNYGPTFLGAGLASIVSSVVVLMLFAAAIRNVYRRRARRADLNPDDGIGGQAEDFSESEPQQH